MKRVRSFFPLILLFSLSVAQTPDQATKFRLAQSYEQGGDLENAVKLYQQLYSADTSNYVYFESLRRTLQQLKRYDESAALLQQRLAVNPDDINLRGLLGSVYYKAGKEKEALTEWDRALAVQPSNANVYRAVSNIMIENRLLDKAAETYRRARIACKDPNLFTIDLAQLLATSLDYAGATTEYLRWLKQNPGQLGFVQGRMTVYSGKEEGRAAAVQVLKQSLRSEEDIQLYRLIAWLQLEGKNFTEAFEVYKRIDKLVKAQGGEVFAFAERAYKEGAFDVAAQAYQECLSIPIASSAIPFAKYGFASALKELSAKADTGFLVAAQYPVAETQSRYSGAISYFRRLIDEYPRTEFSARSYFQVGVLQYEKHFDLDQALSSFEHAEQELPGHNPVRLEAALKIAEVLTAKGDTSRAASRYRVLAAAPNATPDQQDEATYRLAELDYFCGRFKEAIEGLNSIAINLKADYANDALLLLSFLQENATTGEAALKEFAKADYLARQRKNTEAIPIFLSIIHTNPQALLVDDALIKVARLQEQARLFTDALASYNKVLTQFKETSIARDRAQFSIGEIYQFGLNDKAGAIAAYEKLLAEYPSSLLTGTARKRIRELRGDTL